jgi:hypothetical protein
MIQFIWQWQSSTILTYSKLAKPWREKIFYEVVIYHILFDDLIDLEL